MEAVFGRARMDYCLDGIERSRRSGVAKALMVSSIELQKAFPASHITSLLPRFPRCLALGPKFIEQRLLHAMHHGSNSHSASRKINFHLAQILAARSVLGLDFVLEVQLYAEG